MFGYPWTQGKDSPFHQWGEKEVIKHPYTQLFLENALGRKGKDGGASLTGNDTSVLKSRGVNSGASMLIRAC